MFQKVLQQRANTSIYGVEIIPGEAQGPGFVKMQSEHFVPQGIANLLTHSSVKENMENITATRRILRFFEQNASFK